MPKRVAANERLATCRGTAWLALLTIAMICWSGCRPASSPEPEEKTAPGQGNK